VQSRQGTAVATPSSPRCAAVTVRHARFSTRSRQLCDEAATGGTGLKRTRKREIIFGRRGDHPAERLRSGVLQYPMLNLTADPANDAIAQRLPVQGKPPIFGKVRTSTVAPWHRGQWGSSGLSSSLPRRRGERGRPVVAELSILDTLAIDCRGGVGTISANGRCNSANLQRDAKGRALVLVLVVVKG
jgi:hypothetical protein